MDKVIEIIQNNEFRILTIQRPNALNALNKQVFDELDAFFSAHHGDLSIRGVIITGSGDKAFAAGGQNQPNRPTVEQAAQLQQESLGMVQMLNNVKQQYHVQLFDHGIRQQQGLVIQIDDLERGKRRQGVL